jgi:hypothetical protein
MSSALSLTGGAFQRLFDASGFVQQPDVAERHMTDKPAYAGKHSIRRRPVRPLTYSSARRLREDGERRETAPDRSGTTSHAASTILW